MSASSHLSVFPDRKGRVTSCLTLLPPCLPHPGGLHCQSLSQISLSFLRLLWSHNCHSNSTVLQVQGRRVSQAYLRLHPVRPAPPRPPRTPCSPVLVVLYILGQVHVEDDEVVHMTSGKRLLYLSAPGLAGPLPHAEQGVVCDVRGCLNV